MIAIPSGVTKEKALDILARMYGDNLHPDGTGECYVKDGKFVLNKYKHSLLKVVKKGKMFLDHLPHSSWTIVHLRKISVGHHCKENAQPFVSLNNRLSLCHNGTVFSTRLLSLYLGTCIGFEATSDSAAICELASRIGMQDLANELEWGGCFFGLTLDNVLQVVKVSGQLGLSLQPDKSCIIASEFDSEIHKSIELPRGYYRFDKDGKFLRHTQKPFFWNGYIEKPKEEPKPIKYENWDGVQYIQKGNESFSKMAKQVEIEYL